MEISMIKKVKLIGYKRIAGKNLTWTPSKGANVIVGTNGCGKSSLIQATGWYPLPASDFELGGYHELVREHKGVLYTMTANYGKATKYSLVVEGVELNPGGTLTVQKELINSKLGVDRLQQEIIFGTKTISSAVVGERKIILNNLAGPAAIYGAKLLRAAGNSLKEHKSVKNYVYEQLTRAAANLVTEEEVQRLNVEIAEYDTRITEMLSRRVSISANLDALRTARTKYANTVSDLSTERLLNKGVIVSDLIREKERLSILQNEEANLTNRIRITQADIIDYENDINERRRGMGGLDYDSIAPIEPEKPLLSRIEFIPVEVRKQLLSVLNARTLGNVLDSLANIPNGFVPLSSLDAARKLTAALTRGNEIDTELAVLEANLSHYHDHTVECPKCGEVFTPDVTADTVTRDKEAHSRLSKESSSLEEDIILLRGISDTLSKADSHYEVVRSRLDASMGDFNMWWRLEASIRENAEMAASKLLSYVTQLKDYCEYMDKYDKFEERQKAFFNVTSSNRFELERLERKHSEIHNTMYSLMTEKSDVEASLYGAVGICKFFEDELETEQLLVTAISELEKCETQIKEVLIQTELVREIQETKLTQNQLTHKLNGVRATRLSHDKVKAEYEEQVARIEVLSKTVDALSPKDGIMAELAMSGLRGVGEAVQAMVGAIWSTEIKMLLPELGEDDNEEVSYSWPIISSEGHVTPDISVANSSTKDVFNTAFRFAYNERLGHGEVVYVDEFGTGFDREHLQRAYTYLRGLLTRSDSPQSFIISHNRQMLDAFYGASVVVISDANVSVPDNIAVNESISFD
jgi:hypothetical protein